MPGSYAVLAPIYDVAGLSAFSKNITPQLLRFLLQRDWLGRSILDLGCGTGASLLWLKQQGYNVAGVDSSPEMLRAARETFTQNGMNITLHQKDMRQLQFNEEYDLVLALNVLNELDNVRDLEATFKSVHRTLKPGQSFAFDLLTIEGLAQGTNTERIFHDDPKTLTVFTRIGYDYERQLRTVRYWLFQHEGSGWQRHETETQLRGYPVQAAVGLFQRSGFDVLNVLTGGFTPYEVGVSGVERVIVVGKKV